MQSLPIKTLNPISGACNAIQNWRDFFICLNVSTKITITAPREVVDYGQMDASDDLAVIQEQLTYINWVRNVFIVLTIILLFAMLAYYKFKWSPEYNKFRNSLPTAAAARPRNRSVPSGGVKVIAAMKKRRHREPQQDLIQEEKDEGQVEVEGEVE